MKPGTPNYKNIAIIKLSSLGDIIHALPAFHVLRKNFPGAKIAWIAESTGAKLLKNVAGIDEIIEFDLKIPGIANKWNEIRRFVKQHKHRFDLVLDFQGLLKSAAICFLLKGSRLGFDKSNLREPLARLFYNQTASPFDEKNHVIFKNLHLVIDTLAHLQNPQAANSEKEPVYPLKPLTMSMQLEEFLENNNMLENNFILLNIGGGWETKLLEMNQYIDILERIKNRFNVLILWGNEKERVRALEISRATGVPVCIFLDFPDLILLIQRCRLIVTADTLAMHIADMVKKPSVGIFGPTSPQRNGSLLPGSIAVYENTPCHFCYKKKCDTIECIKKLNIEKIVHSIEKVSK